MSKCKWNGRAPYAQQASTNHSSSGCIFFSHLNRPAKRIRAPAQPKSPSSPSVQTAPGTSPLLPNTRSPPSATFSLDSPSFHDRESYLPRPTEHIPRSPALFQKGSFQPPRVSSANAGSLYAAPATFSGPLPRHMERARFTSVNGLGHANEDPVPLSESCSSASTMTKEGEEIDSETVGGSDGPATGKAHVSL